MSTSSRSAAGAGGGAGGCEATGAALAGVSLDTVVVTLVAVTEWRFSWPVTVPKFNNATSIKRSMYRQKDSEMMFAFDYSILLEYIATIVLTRASRGTFLNTLYQTNIQRTYHEVRTLTSGGRSIGLRVAQCI